MESPKQNGTQKYLRTICSTMLVFGKQAFQVFFQNNSTNPIISYDVITLELYCSGEVATFLAFRFLLSSIKIQLFLLLSQPHLFLTHVRRVKFLHFEILSPPLRFFNLIRLGLRYLNFPVIQQLHLTVIRSSQNFTRTGTGLLRTSRYLIEISAGPQPASKLSLEYRGGGGKTAREPRFSRRRQSVPVDFLAGQPVQCSRIVFAVPARRRSSFIC